MADLRSRDAEARLDHGRFRRTSEPEVVYGEGKSPVTVARLLTELLAGSPGPVLATRCTPEHAAAFPAGDYDPVSRLRVARRADTDGRLGTTVVACAGTSDLPVASEALGTLTAFGAPAELVADVGVAGLVSCPVVAVPTSVGYGAGFEGLAALLGMLNACAPVVSLVNIDNGFGAALVARRILLAKR